MLLQRCITAMMLLLMTGCAHRSPQQRLAAFINDPENKIVQSIQVGDIQTTAKWLPYQYRNPQAGKQSTHDNYSYFNIRFVKVKGDQPAKEKLLYLNFDMQNDFSLLCAGDSLMPAICQKIENGIPGSYEYMLAFDNSHDIAGKNDFTLYYKDKIFGIGVLAFAYSQRDIRRIPRL